MTRKEAKENLYNQLKKNLHITIDITKEDMDKVISFSKEMEEKKPDEPNYKTDNKNIFQRNLSGKLGEIAIEKYLGIQFVDFSIGESKDYNIPDIYTYELGVKTARLSTGIIYAPVQPKNDEIVCIYDEDKSKVYIMGILNKELVDKYGERSLLPPSVSAYKTGYARYDELIPISFDLLQSYKLRKSA